MLLLITACFSTAIINCDGGGSDSSPSLPEVTNLTVEKVGDKSITLTWVNPPDYNFEKIRITYSESMAPIEVEKDLKTADISVPLNSVKYSFFVKTVGKTGQESEGVCISAIAADKLIYKKSAWHQMGDCICGPCMYESHYDYDNDENLIRVLTYKLNDTGCLIYEPPI